MKRKFPATLICSVLAFLLPGGITLSRAGDEPEAFVYDDHSQRDPFWPLVTTGGAIVNYDTSFSVAEMVLEGVVTAPGGTGIAIINGNVVEQGKRMGSYTVQRIENNKVILVKDGQESVLRLKKEE